MSLPLRGMNSQRIADALFVGIAGLNATLAIVRNEFGDPLEASGVLQWYVLVVVYAVTLWGRPAAIESAPWAGRLFSWSLFSGALVCATLAALTMYSPDFRIIKWYDWALLAICFYLSASGMRVGARR